MTQLSSEVPENEVIPIFQMRCIVCHGKRRPKNLSFSPPAEELTLMRRAYLDLIAFPPDPAEVKSYLKDNRSDAYERLVDRLLESPH